MNIYDLLIILILLSWVGGFSFHIAGAFIHLLLLIALLLLIVRLIRKI